MQCSNRGLGVATWCHSSAQRDRCCALFQWRGVRYILRAHPYCRKGGDPMSSEITTVSKQLLGRVLLMRSAR